MDSLLGIGLGSSKGEGKELASRLTEMRKERNARAKNVTKKEPMKVVEGPNPVGQLSFNAIDEDEEGGDDSMQLVTAGGSSSRGSSSKNKSKKKKKKKNKR